MTRNLKIEIRVTAEEKEQFKQLADSANMDISTLIRTVILSEDKLVLLQDGGTIAKCLSELIVLVQNSDFPQELTDMIEAITDALNHLYDMLPDVSADTENDGKEG